MVNTIWFRFDLIRFRKYFFVCTSAQKIRFLFMNCLFCYSYFPYTLEMRHGSETEPVWKTYTRINISVIIIIHSIWNQTRLLVLNISHTSSNLWCQWPELFRPRPLLTKPSTYRTIDFCNQDNGSEEFRWIGRPTPDSTSITEGKFIHKQSNKQFLLRSIYKINTYLKTNFAYTNKIDPATDNSYKTPELLIFSTRIHLVKN